MLRKAPGFAATALLTAIGLHGLVAGVVAAVASLLPALKVLRLDPARILR